MLVSVELGADIWRGFVHPAMQPPISATHPTPQCKTTGALAMELRPEEDHASRYRGRRFRLG
jgi:hypothetical protein